MALLALLGVVLTAAVASGEAIQAYSCFCSGTNCTQHTITSGRCMNTVPFVAPGIAGGRATCQSTVSQCANLVFFGGLGCDVPLGLRSPVCGSCMSMGPLGKNMYIKVSCGTEQNVALQLGCDTTCSKCSGSLWTPKSSCSSGSDAGTDISVVSQGTSQCATVKIDLFASSSSCSGTPSHTDYAAQDNCVDGFSFSCANKPAINLNKGPNVMVTTCEPNSGCTENCKYETTPSGTCEPVSTTRARRVSCGTSVTRCATLMLFSDTQCQTFTNIWRAPCGACAYTANRGYMKVECGAHDVATMYKCTDATCTNCEAPFSTRPIDRCVSEGLQPFTSAMNLGVHSCNTVDYELFESTSCAAGTKIAQYTASQEGCEFSQQYKCGAFDLTQIRQQQCMCKGGACGDYSYDSGKCASFTYEGAAHSSRTTCVTTPRTCIRLAFFSGSTCASNTWSGLQNFVCNSCNKGTQGYMYIHCDERSQEAWVDTGCNLGCATCTHKNADKVAFRSCGTSLTAGLYIRNEGTEFCDAVRMQYYAGNNCHGANAISDIYMAQGLCSGDQNNGGVWRYTCANAPYPPNTAPDVATTKVLYTKCSSGTCDGKCVSTVMQDGQCLPSTDGSTKSLRVTCLAGGDCAQMVIFRGGACTKASFANIASISCGSCHSFPNPQTGVNEYMRMHCDTLAQSVRWERNCDSTCTKCDQGVSRDMDECDPALFPGYSVVNKGLFKCTNVRIERYKDTTCTAQGGFLTENITAPQASCLMGNSYRCGDFPDTPVAAVATVTRRECGRCALNTTAACMTETFPERECYNVPTQPGQFEYSVTASCETVSGYCTRVAVFNDSSCSEFFGIVNGACNACMRSGGGFFMPMCDKSSQTVTFRTNCNADCSACDPVGLIAPYEQCSNHNRDLSYMRTLGVFPCDTAAILAYSGKNCQSTPYTNRLAQDTCTDGAFGPTASFSCNNAPALKPAPTDYALFTRCTDEWCAMGCQATRYTKGVCVAVNEANGVAARRITCNSVMTQCFQVMLFRDLGCKETTTNRSMLYGGVCGQCINVGGSFYYKTTCNKAAGEASVKFYTNAACTRTVANPYTGTYKQNQCQNFAGVSGLITMLRSCQAAEIEEFSDNACTTVIGRAMYPSESCDVAVSSNTSVRVECGNYTAPTPAPATDVAVVSSCGCDGAPAYPACTKPTRVIGACKDGEKLECGTTVGKCAVAQFFTDGNCRTFKTFRNLVCGQCNMLLGKPVKVTCSDSVSMTIASCTDNACTKCSAPSISSLDMCRPTVGGLYAQMELTEQCNTVTLSRYTNDKCTGAASSVEYASQQTCGFSGFHVTCPNPPPFAASPKGPNVLVSTCAHGTGCSESCVYQSAASGECTPSNEGASTTTCTGEVGQCVTYGFFRPGTGADKCQNDNFVNVFTGVCNRCALLPGDSPTGDNYVYIRCTPSVSYLSAGCDSTCTRCSQIDVSVRPNYDCVPLPGGAFVKSYGLTQCNVIQRDHYSAPTCDPATHVAKLYLAESRCNGNMEAKCGTYNIQEAVGRTCACNGQPGCGAPRRFPSNTCQKHHTGKGSFKASCLTQSAKCVNLAAFNGAQCSGQDYNATYTTMCGSCLTMHGRHIKVDCDGTTLGVTATECSDSNCKTCNAATTKTHNINSCSPAVRPGLSVFNHGTFDCDVMSYLSYPTTDCSGAPETATNVAQGVCLRGWMMNCGNEPYVTPDTTATTVLRTSCADGLCSQQCTVAQHPSGMCVPEIPTTGAVPTKSSRYTCSKTAGRCAVMFIFPGSSTCQYNANFMFYSAKCGSCNFIKNKDYTGWTKYYCDELGLNTTLAYDCNSDCSSCKKWQNRNEGQCVPPLAPTTEQFSLMAGAIMPCDTVDVQHFDGQGCNATDMTISFAGQLGACETGNSYQCGKTFNLPVPVGTRSQVTATTCSGAGGCTDTVFTEGTCQTIAGIPGISYSVACMTKPAMCAQVQLWESTTCLDKFIEVNSYVCNACLNGAYVKCDQETQTVSLLTGCDNLCGKCTGEALSFPQGSCRPGVDNKWHGQLMGMVECDAIAFTQYSGTACQQVTGYATVAQSRYEFNAIKFQCANRPTFTPLNAPEVLTTHCDLPIGVSSSHPAYFCSGPACTKAVSNSGQCTAVTRNGPIKGEKATCGQVGLCATLADYNATVSAGCTRDNFVVVHTMVCGKCIEFRGKHLSVTCDDKTQSVSVKWGCNAACGQCTGPSQTIPKSQCRSDPNPNLPAGMRANMMNFGVEQCNTIHVQKYENAACAGAPRLDVWGADGACEGTTQYKCGTFTPGVTPSPVELPDKYFSLTFPVKSRNEALTRLQLGLHNMGANLADVKILREEPYGDASMVIDFVFIGPTAEGFSGSLAQSILNNKAATAATFNAAAIANVAPGTKDDKKGDDGPSKAVIIGAIVGVLVIVAVVVGAVVFFSRGGKKERSVDPQEVEEPMYAQFEEKSANA